jgi:predicted hydrocarbon binding protein
VASGNRVMKFYLKAEPFPGRSHMLALLLLVLTQIPCTPGETSTVCHCKAGMLSACATLSLENPEKAAEILAQLEKVAAQAQVVDAAAQKVGETREAKVQDSSDCSDPTECKGQLHHVISRPIAKALKDHETLGGHYEARDPRFVTRAVDEQAHCGYQEWHRKVDKEVIEWLNDRRRLTPERFEAFLRQIYRRPEMLKRFPHGF